MLLPKADDTLHPDAALVRAQAADELKVHVRLCDQGLAPSSSGRYELAAAIPELVAFGDHRFAGARVVLDWDHRIPSQGLVLRILAAYSPEVLTRIDTQLAERDRKISEYNVYPEFDVPDYAGIECSESYAAVLRPGVMALEELQLISDWRRQVDPTLARSAASAVTASKGFHQVVAARKRDGLGSAVVVGWAPPCLAHTREWAIEVWTLMDFDGQTGTARVFMVDAQDFSITRTFETNVELS